MKSFDVTILTAKKFFDLPNPNWYEKQVLQEDNILLSALQKKGLKAVRTYWDNPNFDFADTQITLFRTIWDYFHRFNEFSNWLNSTMKKTQLINSPEILYWNIDKHYLYDLYVKGINIPKTFFIERGESKTLQNFFLNSGFEEAILKPAISGAGRHTYKLSLTNILEHEAIYSQLIKNEALLLQEYQSNITKTGEIAVILFNGEYSHSVLKTAKKGDFRVQDDFGGTVKLYTPNTDEIEFAKNVISECSSLPIYARVDIMRDNHYNPVLGELELIEPELWFRFYPRAAEMMTQAICNIL
jgi:glutathione synthase/RimK-type ligase-like ATP-grasp enzyme